MRRRFIHLGTMLILILCIWGHVSEIFDHWDNTFQTGTDIEYSTVIVALVAGAVLGLAHFAVAALRAASMVLFLVSLSVAALPSQSTLADPIGHSPPSPLRI